MTKRLVSLLTVTLLGTLTVSQSMAVGKMSNITNLPPYTAQNCHLGLPEYALLQTLREKVYDDDRAPTFLSGPTTATPSPVVANQENVETSEVVPSLRKRAPPATVEESIPHLIETRAKIASLMDSLRPLRSSEVKALIVKNPLIRACQISVQGTLLDYLNKFGVTSNEKAHYADAPAPLLAILQIVSLNNFNFRRQIGSSYEEALDFSIRTKRDSILDGTTLYTLSQILIYTHRSISESLDPKDFPLDLSTTLTKIFRNGQINRYRMVVEEKHYLANGLSLSQMVPSELKANLIFDSSVIDGLYIANFGGHMSSQDTSALLFNVGTDSRETTIKNSIEDCFRGFKPSEKKNLHAQITSYFNSVCSAKGDQIGFFAPVHAYLLPELSWENVNRVTMANPHPNPKDMDDEIKQIPASMIQKEYLRASGHDTDFDVLVQGQFFMTDRTGFYKKMKAVAEKVWKKPLNEEQVKVLVSVFVSKLGNFLTDNISVDEKQKRPNYEKIMETLRSYFLNGGIGFALAMMSEESHDEPAVQVAYRMRDQKFEVIGLHSEAVIVNAMEKYLTGLADPEKKPLLKNLFGAPVFCAAQMQRLETLTKAAIGKNGAPQTRQDLRKWIQDKELINTQAEAAMSGLCLASFHEQSQKELATAREYLKRMGN